METGAAGSLGTAGDSEQPERKEQPADLAWRGGGELKWCTDLPYSHTFPIPCSTPPG